MKVKVIKRFIDKHTGKVHKEGDILNIDKKRLEEIKEVEEKLSEKLVEEIAEKKPTKKAKKETE